MKKFRKILLPFAVISVLFVLATAVWSKDAVVAAVSNPQPDPPGAIITENGTHYSRGTYAIGTIQLYYTVTATQFSAGCNHSFDVELNYQDNGKGKPSKYPLNLNFRQTGSANLNLVPTPAGYPGITRASFPLNATLDICVPADVANDPEFQVDGTDLVGNLQLETVPKGANLDTVTTIQVHLILVHPSEEACLKTYDFFSNTGVTSTGELTASNRFQISKSSRSGNVSCSPNNPRYWILVANTCSTDQCIDIDFDINSNLQLSGGNPVKVFSSNTIIDEYLELSTFWATTPSPDSEGSTTCVFGTAPCTNVPASSTYLLMTNFGCTNSTPFPPLGQDASHNFSYTGFGANIYDGGSTSSCTVAGTLHSLADPSQLSDPLPSHCNDTTVPNPVTCDIEF